ncbi:MAG: ferritin family protein [Myxococcales bacterium]|nr:ferritin family protein [Myxococcales bacterium]
MTTKVRGIDFATLTLKDALDLAVLVEEEAMDRYGELADQLELHRTGSAARFFRFMEGNEAKHRAALLEQRTAKFGDEPRSVTRTMLFDIEAPDYDEARIFMTVREALGTAMRSETKARAFFEEALPSITDPDVKALFEELVEEEIEHQQLVQKEIDKLGPPENDPSDDPEDYSDGPVSH